MESHTSADEKQLIPFRTGSFSQPKAQWSKVGTPKPLGRDHAISQLQWLQLSGSHTGSASPGLPAPPVLQHHRWPGLLQGGCRGMRGPQQRPRGDRPCQLVRGDLSTARHPGHITCSPHKPPRGNPSADYSSLSYLPSTVYLSTRCAGAEILLLPFYRGGTEKLAVLTKTHRHQASSQSCAKMSIMDHLSTIIQLFHAFLFV